MNFTYLMPTRIILGRDCLVHNSHYFKTLGHKALIVTGKNSAKKSGALDQVIEALTTASISYKIFDEVEPNPSIACVCKGGELAKNFGANFVIGIGGGSPMDAAKAIALVAQNGWSEDLFRQSYKNRPLPIVAVPTTAGTGSEVTQYSIVTDSVNQTKRSIATPDIFPTYSFLDGQFMEKLSAVNTINTAIDAFSHAAEGYLAGRANRLSDTLAEESMNILGQYLFGLKEKELTLEDRDQLLYASMLAGMVIAQTGTTIVHGMGYSLTYFRHIDHGRANGLLFSSFLRFSMSENAKKVQKIIELLGAKDLNDFTSKMNHLLGEKEVFTREELEDFSARAIKTGNVNNTRPVPTKEQLIAIYCESLLDS